MKTGHVGALFTASFLLCAAAAPSAARADTDACNVLTPAQVSAAVGAKVPAGSHVSPGFVGTCTWQAPGSKVKFVTLKLQTSAAYDAGKRMAAEMAAAGAGVKAAAVGDDAYYFVAGEQANLLVKHGGGSFKISVYATIPVEQKEAIELALAKEAVAKL